MNVYSFRYLAPPSHIGADMHFSCRATNEVEALQFLKMTHLRPAEWRLVE